MCDLNKNSNFKQINHKNKIFNSFIRKFKYFSFGDLNSHIQCLVINESLKDSNLENAVLVYSETLLKVSQCTPDDELRSQYI